MDEVVAAGLQIDALARRVGADQDADRLLVRVGVERALDLLPTIRRRGSSEDPDAIVGAVGLVEGFAQAAFQPAAGVLVFGEDYEAARVPGRSVEHVSADPVE